MINFNMFKIINRNFEFLEYETPINAIFFIISQLTAQMPGIKVFNSVIAFLIG